MYSRGDNKCHPDYRNIFFFKVWLMFPFVGMFNWNSGHKNRNHGASFFRAMHRVENTVVLRCGSSAYFKAWAETFSHFHNLNSI